MRFFYVNAEDAICVTWGDKVLSYCERLMLASRRAKKRVFVLKRMRLRSDVAVGQHLVAPRKCRLILENSYHPSGRFTSACLVARTRYLQV